MTEGKGAFQRNLDDFFKIKAFYLLLFPHPNPYSKFRTGHVFKNLIWIQQLSEFRSKTDPYPDPKPWLQQCSKLCVDLNVEKLW